MNALRMIQEVENGRLAIELPEPFRKGRIEIIIMRSDEAMPSEDIEIKKNSDEFDPDRFRGVWKYLNLDAEKICREMREEWDQRF